MTAFLGAIELGLIYSLLTYGIFISFRILKVPDLTVEGSFVLGAASSAMLTIKGMPHIGVVAAVVLGALAGIATALQQTKLGIQPVLAGILTSTGLYTINLLVMGGAPNQSLLNRRTIFTLPEQILGPRLNKVLLLVAVVAVFYLLLNFFFQTQLGLSIRATGDNETMVRASSIDTDATKIVAFGISNALVALSGALLAQMQQSADMTLGSGMIVIGLASLIIGQVLIQGRGMWFGLLSVVIGAVLYRLLIAFILSTAVPASALKLISALVVIAAISLPGFRKKFGFTRLVRKETDLCSK